MRTISRAIFLLSLLITGLTTTKIYATTFTAAASGDWSSTTTWGGTVPSTMNTGDAIIIPSGIKVTLKNNLTIKGALASLDVEGTLSDSTDTLMVSSLGSVSGAGTINFGTANWNTTSSFLFTGSLNVKNLMSSQSVSVSAKVSVSGSLMLDSGVFKLMTGSTLALGSGATIYISMGSFFDNGGIATLTGSYNVYYMTNSAITGLEITGSGLNDVTVNVGSNNNVKLSSDLDVNGTFYLTSGTLTLNNHNLTLNGYISSSDSLGGNIYATSSSSIYAYAKASTNIGSLKFASNGSTLSKFEINTSNSADLISISTDLMIMDSLVLSNGRIKLTGNNNTLEVASTGKIGGSSSSSYVVTGNNTYLKLNLSNKTGAGSLFPVGTQAHYAPANVFLNTGTPDGAVSVRTQDGVYEKGTSGLLVSQFQPSVNMTWFVTSDITSNLNMTLSTYWTSDMEVNNFNRSKSYISHYHDNAWDTFSISSANSFSNPLYGSTRTGITSLSPFAVYDQSTQSGIEKQSVTTNVSLFPNPASGYINVMIDDATQKTASFQLEIRDMTGRLVSSSLIGYGNNQINTGSLSNGNYMMKIYNNQTNVVKKFIKI